MEKGVITLGLIVTLIIAGMQNTTFTGSSDILNSAQAAAVGTTLNSAKEQIELKITEGITNFYRIAYLGHNTTSMSKQIDKKINNNELNEDIFKGVTYNYEVNGLSDDTIANITLKYNGNVDKNYEYIGKVNMGTGEIDWSLSEDLEKLLNDY